MFMEGKQQEVIFKECVVVGAGISGIAVARWLKVKKHMICLIS